MAEVLVFVTDEARPDDMYQDGDIIAALNRRRIRQCHAEMICDHRRAGFNSDGLRPAGGIYQEWFERVYQFKFERISKREVRRIEIATQQSVVFSDAPNADGHHIDVPLYIQRRKRDSKHRIFGVAGSEFWYGGLATFDHTALDAVWASIEANTSYREADYTRWPLSLREKHKFLALPFADGSDETYAAMVTTEHLSDPQQPDYVEEPEEGVTPSWLLVRKRRVNLPWRDVSGVVSQDVLNESKEIDYRDTVAAGVTADFTVKPRLNFWTNRDHLIDLGGLFNGG